MAEKYDEELLLGYVEGDLDSSSRAQVEQWLREDPRLARLLSSLAADRAALRQLPDPGAPDWLMDEVDRQLERAMLVDEPTSATTAANLRKHHVLRRIMVIGAVAAMFIVVGGAVIYSLQPTSNIIDTVAMRDDKPALAPASTVAAATSAAQPAPAPAVPPVPATPAAPAMANPTATLSTEAVTTTAAKSAAAAEPTPTALAGAAPSPTARREMLSAAARAKDTAFNTLSAAAGAAAPAQPAEMLSRNPVAPAMQLRIVTRDRQKTLALLNAPTPAEKQVVADQFDRITAAPAKKAEAAWQPLTESSDVSAYFGRAPRTTEPAIRVDPAQLQQLMAELKADPVNTTVELVPQVAAKAPAPAAAPAAPIDRALWPSLKPDYRRLIEEQLKPAPEVSAAPTGPITVIIEDAPAAAPPAEKPAK